MNKVYIIYGGRKSPLNNNAIAYLKGEADPGHLWKTFRREYELPTLPQRFSKEDLYELRVREAAAIVKLDDDEKLQKPSKSMTLREYFVCWLIAYHQYEVVQMDAVELVDS